MTIQGEFTGFLNKVDKDEKRFVWLVIGSVNIL